MRVLVACEESQAVTIAFRDRGHEAYSCDIQDCSGGHPEWHYKCDVFDIIHDGWDLMVAHPPCTFMANSGVRWLYNNDGTTNRQRWSDLKEASTFFAELWDAPIERIAIENPIPHKYAMLPPYTQVIQPWMFGDNFSKATCLWLRGLYPLVPYVVSRPANIEHACHLEPPGPDRQKNRSKTYPGIAAAMADQWGGDWVPELAGFA